jgi:hypothetical protein
MTATGPKPFTPLAKSLDEHLTVLLSPIISLLSLLIWIYLFFGHGRFWRSATPPPPSFSGYRCHRSRAR